MAFKVKKVKPLFTNVITTALTYSEDVRSESGLYLGTTKMAGSMNPYQWVVAVGSTVHDIKEGDIVYINFNRYAKIQHAPGSINDDNIQQDNMTYQYSIPCIEIDGKQYLRIQNADIEYVVTEFDGIEAGGLLE